MQDTLVASGKRPRTLVSQPIDTLARPIDSIALVLSHFEVKPLLAADHGTRTLVSPDLGRTQTEVVVLPEGVLFFASQIVTWEQIRRIAEEHKKCFRITEHGAEDIRVFSTTTQWVRSLWPTGSAPTTVVAGFPMHRIQGVDPWEDTRRKVEMAAPLRGNVLDTATGLGYTAIYAARKAKSVVTIELDPAALELARLNPWSRELFESPNIERRIGRAEDEIATFADGSFARVIHDPPTFKLGGQLYSAAFYRELHRVLQYQGCLAHYIGDPASESGKRVTRGVIERLREAGFARVIPKPGAFGVVAIKAR